MALSLEMQSVKDVTVLRVAGRIVLGDDLSLLEQKISSALKESAELVINLSAVDYVDSSGLGALVRHVTAARARRKKISLCGLTPNVRKVLDITRVIDLFQTYATEAEALAARGSNLATPTHAVGAPARILCVDASLDMLAYLRGVLQPEGYQVFSSSNFPDAQLLLKSATVLVFGPNLVPSAEGSSVDALRRLAPNVPVVSVAQQEDAAAMARELQAGVKAALSDSK
ncbi:MAG TPA: anti-sigma factor antagonist [Terriglobales bacterium]|nr:anti-sigma factor antagonist [Terriglobales bacterium]